MNVLDVLAKVTDAQKAKVRMLAQAVLDARARYHGATLGDLYDPDIIKADLYKAHRQLDAAVDKLYRATPFASHRDRVEHLFAHYEKLSAPLAALAQPVKVPRRKRAA